MRIANDEGMLEMALVENIQREELDAIEVAISFQRLIDEVNMTQEQLSEKVGKMPTVNELPASAAPARCHPVGIAPPYHRHGPCASSYLVWMDPALESRNREPTRCREPIEREAGGGMAWNSASYVRRSTKTTTRPNEVTQQAPCASTRTKVLVKQDTEGHGRIEIPFSGDIELQRLLFQPDPALTPSTG